jgi:hypothetical protein
MSALGRAVNRSATEKSKIIEEFNIRWLCPIAQAGNNDSDVVATGAPWINPA